MVTTGWQEIASIARIWAARSSIGLGRGKIPRGRGYLKGSWIGGGSKISQWAIACKTSSGNSWYSM